MYAAFVVVLFFFCLLAIHIVLLTDDVCRSWSCVVLLAKLYELLLSTDSVVMQVDGLKMCDFHIIREAAVCLNLNGSCCEYML